MADENSDRDLFGDPFSGLEKGRGRPPHERTRETTNRVILGFARGWRKKEVAQSIGVTVPTLDKYYFDLVSRAQALALQMESVQLGRLNDEAAKGNVAAEKELLKQLARGRLEATAGRFRGDEEPKAKPEKLGKKEKAKRDAAEQRGIFEPPPAPTLLNPQGNA